jgi:hypothetical protein
MSRVAPVMGSASINAFRRASQDIVALNNGISSMTEKAAKDFETAARKVGEPSKVVGEEVLLAAGDKPRKSKSAD